MKPMTFKEVADLYCDRQEQSPEGLREILLGQKERYSPTGFMLLECPMMDSSYFGSLAILPFGPNNTFKEVPNHPISPRGLASDTSVVIGVLKAEDL